MSENRISVDYLLELDQFQMFQNMCSLNLAGDFSPIGQDKIWVSMLLIGIGIMICSTDYTYMLCIRQFIN